MTRANAIYRVLLYCYPAAFRNEYGNQMLLMFSEELEQSRRVKGRAGAASTWFRAAADALTIAPKEHWHVILQDLRYACRTMAANPSFAAVAILSLALGIGANTAIFSLWNGVLHSSLPVVHAPEQLVMLSNPESEGVMHGGFSGDRSLLTYQEFEQLRQYADRFSAMMASQSSLDTWRVRMEGGDWEETRGRLVSGRFFEVLGVNPALGRGFTAADDHDSIPQAVISYSYWERRFGGRPDILGKTIEMRKTALTIIGVAPPGFVGETSGQRPDLWAPLRMQASVEPGEDRLHDTPPEKVMWLHLFGRLKPGVSQAQAEAQANGIFKTGLQSFYGNITSEDQRRGFLDQRLLIHPARQGASRARSQFSASLSVLLAAIGLLLLIACANLANLLLARGAARRPEIALRLSMGASRGRLIRQLLTESLALAAVGGACGLLLAYVFHRALVVMMTESNPDFQMGLALNPLVLAFAATVTIASAILFGIFPAWQITSADVGDRLKEQSRSVTGSVGKMRWGKFLVSLQLALSLPLLVGAGLLAHSLYNLNRVDLGYPTDHLLLVTVGPDAAGYAGDRRLGLLRDLREQFQLIPGVKAVSFSHNGIFSGSNSMDDVEVEGYVSKGDEDRGSSWEMVSPGYFTTLGVPIILGREILDSDTAAAPKVCVINEAFAKQFFVGRNPIGMHITNVYADSRITHQIVGIAKNARTRNLRVDARPRYFVPATQPLSDNLRGNFFVRTSRETGPVLAAIRQTVQRADPALPILSARTAEEQLAPATAQDRATAQLAIVFGAVALSLAAIGLYGVLSYGVARRQREIAVRIALGALPGRVVWMILHETGAVVLVGLALGAGLGYAASRIVTSQLFGVAPQDPLTLALAGGLLVAVAASAAYLPARRASKLDPMAALRQE